MQRFTGQNITKLRREVFSKVLELAKFRGEIHRNADVDLIIDLVSGSLYYALIFKPTTEPVETYMRRTINLLLEGVGSREGRGARGKGDKS
ncbi:TetR-like C-terminal domain-containing protein [Nostoc sp. UHCC 0251]|uniref:TetR-like C-terminal domain-containing protein n=1 Tax=Nostoc sp. UHCC 0251 TaxID=3110240 RepID=UPI002B1F556B|nr:TetR-like C-terminal domain-containing protein [Nostoc sp. UHCC 0251]MEA5627834.1 TetR-like C-terminal domain-containing protein [Nostoc sp. UHCC 0251]